MRAGIYPGPRLGNRVYLEIPPRGFDNQYWPAEPPGLDPGVHAYVFTFG